MMDSSNNATVGESNTGYPSIDDVGALGFEVDKEGSESPADKAEEDTENDPMEKKSEKSIDEILEELNKKESKDLKESSEKSKEDESFLIKHNGEVKKLGKDEIVEYAQKGFDYTQKTQALAEKEKDFSRQVEDFNKQIEAKNRAIMESQAKHHTQLEEYNTLDFAMAEMQEKDPDLFEEVARYYQEAVKLQNTPANKAIRQEMQTLKNEIEKLTGGNAKINNQRESELILEKYNTEVESIKRDLVPKISNLGIKVDLEKVKQAWIEGEASNLSVRQAFDLLYSEPIRKAYDSKLKVSRLQGKGNSRSIVSAGTAKGSTNAGSKSLSWNAIEQGGYKDFLK